LHVLRQDPSCEVGALLTTFNRSADRVAMHAVRRALVHAQAEAAGLPLWEAFIPSPCPNDVYEAEMGAVMARAAAEGYTHVAFGDLFLEDIRRYREEKLAGTGLEPLFPLWGIPTDDLAREMMAGGLEAVITCVDPRQIDRTFAGRPYDARFVASLPSTADPCGERGEFHTFCHAGPMFQRPIPAAPGEVVERDGFVFADVRPGANPD
jgi:diphthamide synthase (EF-2-diphthine--ammonia ligase)